MKQNFVKKESKKLLSFKDVIDGENGAPLNEELYKNKKNAQVIEHENKVLKALEAQGSGIAILF